MLTELGHRVVRIAKDGAEAVRDYTRITPPAIRGLGQSNGFQFELLNTGGLSREKFAQLHDQLLASAQRDPKLTAIRASELPDTPQLKIDLDEEKLAVLGLT